MKFLALISICFLTYSPFGFAKTSEQKTILAEVAGIHGAAGPFAVAGHRMASHALNQWGLKKGTWAIKVIHYTPAEVQYSCVADGWQAATGVSSGKLNLQIEEAPKEQFKTVVIHNKSGRKITYKLTQEFMQQFYNVERDKKLAAGAKVAAMKEQDIFAIEPNPN